MALSVTFNRTDNTFRVSAASGDTGKLRIQYNQSDIYNNLSGAAADITAGAETSIAIPLVSGNIPAGVYRFDFDASAGSSYDIACNFQIADISPVLTETIDTLAPSFRVDDDTDYSIDNGTISSASRTLTVSYPAGTPTTVSDLSATAADITTDLYASTFLLYEGVMQTDLQAVLTYTIATTTGYTVQSGVTRQGFDYTTTVSGYSQSPQLRNNEIDDLYTCLETLREKVATAELNDRASFSELKSDYAYAAGLLSQYKEALYVGNSGDLETLKLAIEKVTGCTTTDTTNTNSTPERIFGLGLAGTVNEISKLQVTISAAQMVALNTTPVKILSTDSNYIYVPISGAVICSSAQASGTPGTSLGVVVQQGSVYDAQEEIMGTTLPVAVDAANDYCNLEVYSSDKLSAGAEGWYFTATADNADWDGDFLVVVYYSVTKIA